MRKTNKKLRFERSQIVLRIEEVKYLRYNERNLPSSRRLAANIKLLKFVEHAAGRRCEVECSRPKIEFSREEEATECYAMIPKQKGYLIFAAKFAPPIAPIDAHIGEKACGRNKRAGDKIRVDEQLLAYERFVPTARRHFHYIAENNKLSNCFCL